jgi:hypothetical protein
VQSVSTSLSAKMYNSGLIRKFFGLNNFIDHKTKQNFQTI